MTEKQVFEKLRPLIREVTGLRKDQIEMDSLLMHDLGAESIDLLDLSFLIEETFGVTLEGNEFEREASQRIPGGVFEKDGYLTAEALEELRKAMPEVPDKYLQPGLKKIELPSVLNVAVLVHLIQRKLAGTGQEVRNAQE